ncbi:MAG: hexosyltransferase [Methylobacter sp.]|nr:MAG: hexosyltransferase [Methylobacter sp.]
MMKLNSLLKICVIFQRFGPYHHARLLAASMVCNLSAIEYSAFDDTYAWDMIPKSNQFCQTKLFTDECLNQQSHDDIKDRLWLILKELAPDVVAIPGWSSHFALLALSWCRKNNVPTIIMSDSQEIDEPRIWWKDKIKSLIVNQFSSGFVAGISHRHYLHKLGQPSERIFLGYDVVDNNHFDEGASNARKSKKQLKSLMNLPEQYFITSNRFIEKKNILRLIDAYDAYKNFSVKPAWHLVIIGDGLLRSTLEKKIDNLGLTEWVHLPGFIQYPKLPIYYGLAEVYIQASTTEQWGLAVNEAMASSLPVLVSNRCGCVSDLVNEGMNGFTFDPYDVNALVELMLRVAADDFDHGAMGTVSREIIDRWTPEVFAINLLKAANAALKAPRPKMTLLDRALLWTLIRR